MRDSEDNNDARTTGSALGKGLTILEALGDGARGLSIAEIVARTDLPKQTVHRVAGQLEELGLIARDHGGDRYRFAGRLRRLARSVLTSGAQTLNTRRILTDLVGELGETCNVGILDGAEVLYIDRVECHWPLRMQLHPGSRVPVHCTALGKLLLAHLEPDRVQSLVNSLPLEQFTPHTLVTPDALQSALKTIREQGYAVNEEEDFLGLSALAVPVRDISGRVMAGLAVHAPIARFPLSKMLERRGLLEEAAQRIGAELFQSAGE